MGLFNFFKKGVLKKVAKTVEKSVKNVPNVSIKSGSSQQSPPPSSAVNRAPSPEARPNPSSVSSAAASRTASSARTSVSVDQKFDEILSTEFSDLSVMKNVSAESIGISALDPCQPYSYVLQRDGKTVLAIMLTPHNRDKNTAYINARKSAKDSQIVFLNFFRHFPNERDYIVSRIRDAL